MPAGKRGDGEESGLLYVLYSIHTIVRQGAPALSVASVGKEITMQEVYGYGVTEGTPKNALRWL